MTFPALPYPLHVLLMAVGCTLLGIGMCYRRPRTAALGLLITAVGLFPARS